MCVCDQLHSNPLGGSTAFKLLSPYRAAATEQTALERHEGLLRRANVNHVKNTYNYYFKETESISYTDLQFNTVALVLDSVGLLSA